jgi:hypothetical protein
MPSFKDIIHTALVVVAVLVVIQSTVGVSRLDVSKLLAK